MSVRILEGDIHLFDLKTRLPFKYGIATMTQAPQAFVRLVAEIDGKPAPGIAADILPPKWFSKVPDKPLDVEIHEMLGVIENAVACSIGVSGPTVFDAWQTIYSRQTAWGQKRRLPSLLSQFGATLVERALIEAYCRAMGRPFAACVRDGSLGIRLEHFDARLTGHTTQELLPATARRRVIARHTVGMADPLEETDIPESERLGDGLPHSLAACIERYGLVHFKLKVSGQLEADIERLARVKAVLERQVKSEFRFTLDGNESFHSLDAFRHYWESLTNARPLAALFQQLLFVEQPFHRAMALNPEKLKALADWRERPTLIIDESDAEMDSLARALDLGYHGTSHKNCKGVLKGVANACLLRLLTDRLQAKRLVMSGEDLANIGPVALLQDLAVVASLGVESVERNGHHYFAGLSAFPKTIQASILKQHGDLYQLASRGWPTLRIVAGQIQLESVIAAPLGVGFELDVDAFDTSDSWKNNHPLTSTTS